MVFDTTFRMLKFGAVFLFKGKVLRKEEGAAFASRREYTQYLNNRNRGLLLNGDKLKLSEPESFQNVCVIARVGAGKTTRYIIPNVLNRAREKCSMVINDPKGEVYEQTSGYLASCGYEVILFNPQDPTASHCFNPLQEAKNEIEQEQIAEILVKCGNPSAGKDEFWNSGAIRFVSVFIKCLANAGKDNPEHYNLANLYYLFQHFGQDGAPLDEWLSKATINPDDINDETSPIEAGLGWITKTKDTQFISRDYFAQQRIDGISKKLVAFEIDGRRVPRHDYPIEDVDGNVIGKVTSGTLSPSLGIPIGLGYVEKAFSAVDTEIYVSLGRKRLPAKVVKLPFYKA